MASFIGDRVVEGIALTVPAETADRHGAHRMVRPGLRARVLRSAPALCSLGLFAADAFAFDLSAEAVVKTATPGGAAPLAALAALFAGLVLYLAFNGRYTGRTRLRDELRVVGSAAIIAIAAIAILGLVAGDVLPRGPLIATLLLFPPVATFASRLARRALRRAGVWVSPIVIVGVGPSAVEAEEALTADPSMGYRVVRRIGPEMVMDDDGAPTWQSVLDRFGAQRLLVALEPGSDMQRRVVESLLRERVPFAVVSQSGDFPAFSHDVTRLPRHDAVVLSYRDGLSRPWPRIVKAAIDVSLASLLLVLTAPVFLLIAIANRRDGGPVMFAHRRVGAGGRAFYCLKFRTMVVDSDRVLREALARDPALAAEWSATRKLRNDPRVTRVGRFLRSTSLDELPQLINILRLEMSLVGPRPIVQGEVELYGDDIAQYYATRPGLTGLWQVSGRSNTSYARRVELDVWYVNNWTLWNDIMVMLKTIPAVLAREGAH